jgi:hypothetical protein
MTKWGRRIGVSTFVITAIVAVWCPVARAEEGRWWVGGSGNWDQRSHWSVSAHGPGGASKPGASDDAELLFEDGINRQVVLNTNTPLLNVVDVDSTGPGTLTLRMTGGSFNSYALFLGADGSASFAQTGGQYNGTVIYLGERESGHGAYTLSGGTLHLDAFMSAGGFSGKSTFVQTGGTFDGGASVNAGSTWNISAGRMNSDALRVSGGTFTQSGGTIIARRFQLTDDDSSYVWSGGSLSVTGNFQIKGSMTFPTQPVALNLNGLVDLDHAQLINAKNVTLNLGSNAILTFSALPEFTFGHFHNAGIAHFAGTPLIIPARRHFEVSGNIFDPVDVYGTLNESQVDFLTLNHGFTLRPGGALAISRFVESDGQAQVLGGQFDGNYVEIRRNRSYLPIGYPGSPPAPPTYITQSGGRVNIENLQVGWTGGGEYRLSGGRLTCDNILMAPGFPAYVSQDVPGSLGKITQTGGYFTVKSELRMGEGYNTDATFTLAGGTLHVGSLLVGYQVPPPDGIFSVSLLQGRGTGHFEISKFATRLEVTKKWEIGPGSTFTAVPTVAAHLIGANFDNHGTSSSDVSGLDVLRMVFEGGTNVHASFEVAGRDLGPTSAGYTDNFVIDTLWIGGDTPAWVKLVDNNDNQPGTIGAEALYVRHLVISPGSTLDLNGFHIYAQETTNAGTLLTAIHPMASVPEPALMVALLPMLSVRRRRD